jgi:hypothetical protein
MPVFLYFEYKYDPENPDNGLFRSAYLVCVSGYMRDYHCKNTEACVV